MAVDTEIWGVIPARGGSKSIPKKNLTSFAGKPLLDYVVDAAKKSNSLSRIICSTENTEISEHCNTLGIHVDNRPRHLAEDNSNVVEVLIEFLQRVQFEEKSLPLGVALLQPTSPFLRPEHIDRCVKILRERSHCMSVQTISTIPHNYHAYNQRKINGELIRFAFEKERKAMFNKQLKPDYYGFGNLVVSRSIAIIEGKGIFAEPSIGVQIPSIYSFDLDVEEDIALGEYLLTQKDISN